MRCFFSLSGLSPPHHFYFLRSWGTVVRFIRLESDGLDALDSYLKAADPAAPEAAAAAPIKARGDASELPSVDVLGNTVDCCYVAAPAALRSSDNVPATVEKSGSCSGAAVDSSSRAEEVDTRGLRFSDSGEALSQGCSAVAEQGRRLFATPGPSLAGATSPDGLATVAPAAVAAARPAAAALVVAVDPGSMVTAAVPPPPLLRGPLAAPEPPLEAVPASAPAAGAVAHRPLASQPLTLPAAPSAWAAAANYDPGAATRRLPVVISKLQALPLQPLPPRAPFLHVASSSSSSDASSSDSSSSGEPVVPHSSAGPLLAWRQFDAFDALFDDDAGLAQLDAVMAAAAAAVAATTTSTAAAAPAAGPPAARAAAVAAVAAAMRTPSPTWAVAGFPHAPAAAPPAAVVVSAPSSFDWDDCDFDLDALDRLEREAIAKDQQKQLSQHLSQQQVQPPLPSLPGQAPLSSSALLAQLAPGQGPLAEAEGTRRSFGRGFDLDETDLAEIDALMQQHDTVPAAAPPGAGSDVHANTAVVGGPPPPVSMTSAAVSSSTASGDYLHHQGTEAFLADFERRQRLANTSSSSSLAKNQRALPPAPRARGRRRRAASDRRDCAALAALPCTRLRNGSRA